MNHQSVIGAALSLLFFFTRWLGLSTGLSHTLERDKAGVKRVKVNNSSVPKTGIALHAFVWPDCTDGHCLPSI